MLVYYCAGTHYILHAVRNLLEDDAFKLDTERIKAAVEAAQKVETWVKTHTTESAYFQDQLLKQMKKCVFPLF